MQWFLIVIMFYFGHFAWLCETGTAGSEAQEEALQSLALFLDSSVTGCKPCKSMWRPMCQEDDFLNFSFVEMIAANDVSFD